MLKIPFVFCFLCITLSAQSQINPYQDFISSIRKEYKFDSLEIPSPFDLEVPKFNPPEGILKNNPFVQDIAESPVYQPAMPILHPELEGYQMPVYKPDPSVDHSLLMLPLAPIPPFEHPKKD